MTIVSQIVVQVIQSSSTKMNSSSNIDKNAIRKTQYIFSTQLYKKIFKELLNIAPYIVLETKLINCVKCGSSGPVLENVSD